MRRRASQHRRGEEKETSEEGESLLRDVIVPANNEDRQVPALRKFNFSMTNTFKALSLTMVKDGVLRTPHEDYSAHLRAWTRDLYDSFRRGERVWFQIEGKKQYSTVAQLHFFMVGHKTGNNEAVIEHEAVVEEHSKMQHLNLNVLLKLQDSMVKMLKVSCCLLMS